MAINFEVQLNDQFTAQANSINASLQEMITLMSKVSNTSLRQQTAEVKQASLASRQQTAEVKQASLASRQQTAEVKQASLALKQQAEAITPLIIANEQYATSLQGIAFQNGKFRAVTQQSIASVINAGKVVQTTGNHYMNDLQPGVKQARFTMMSFNRIIQDTPFFMRDINFGILAISNNVPVLAEAFTSLTSKTKSFRGAMKLLKVEMMSINGIMFGINLLISMILAFSIWNEKNTRETKKATEAIKEEDNAIQSLARTVASSTIDVITDKQLANLDAMYGKLLQTEKLWRSMDDAVADIPMSALIISKLNTSEKGISSIIIKNVKDQVSLTKERADLAFIEYQNSVKTLGITFDQVPVAKELLETYKKEKNERDLINQLEAVSLGITKEKLGLLKSLMQKTNISGLDLKQSEELLKFIDNKITEFNRLSVITSTGKVVKQSPEIYTQYELTQAALITQIEALKKAKESGLTKAIEDITAKHKDLNVEINKELELYKKLFPIETFYQDHLAKLLNPTTHKTQPTLPTLVDDSPEWVRPKARGMEAFMQSAQTFDQEAAFLEAGVSGIADTLTDTFNQMWVDIFGEANSLLEQFMANLASSLAQIATQQIATGLIAGIFGGGGDLTGIAGWVKKLFVSDAVITPQGQVIQTDPADYLFATKNPGNLARGGNSQPQTINLQVDSKTFMSYVVAPNLGNTMNTLSRRGLM